MIRALLLISLAFSTLLNAQIDVASVDSLERLRRHYYDLGDYTKALDIQNEIIDYKIKFLPKDDVSVLKSQITAVFSEINVFKLKEAQNVLDEIIGYVSVNPTKYESIELNLLFANANLNFKQGNSSLAESLFDEFIQKASKNTAFKRTKEYVDCLTEIAYFHTADVHKVISTAKLAYESSQLAPVKNSLTELKAILAITRATVGAEDYEKVKKFSNDGLKLIERLNKNSNHNSIKTKRYARQLTAYNALASYRRKKEHTIETLEHLNKKLEYAIQTFISEKTVLQDQGKMNLLLSSNNDYFELAKRICWELYTKTDNAKYMDQIMSLHESYLYNKIRIRLNSKKTVFKDIPTEVFQREKELVTKLYYNLDSITTKDLALKEKWSSFQDSLKKNFPKYHDFKYGPIIQPLGDIQSKLPPETTVVRYFYLLDRLHVFVCNSEEKLIIQLPFINIDPYLLKLKKASDINTTGSVLQALYQKLWEPIAEKVMTKNVVIIPDGNLFNLSFEMLTSEKINAYEDFATKSLLANYNISYNYSLFLINKDSKILEFEDDFIAYAPEFDDNMKSKYKLALKDSTSIDKSYLTLLPQPFQRDLVTKYTKLFNGSSYLNEKASKQFFSKTAKEHKIIHIGTHAEANNEAPELSRLIFAKNVSDTTLVDDNFLYTYEIYNQNLSSNLAILTACETGKPSYQPGEGMISLAHAFNYAGSESILTSLWQIDEKSSTQILGHFYEFLYDGKPKDEALRLAKLEYIKNAKGRTKNPEYWAGLILMGDTASIKISDTTNWLYWVLGIVSLLLLSVFIKNRLRRS